MFDIGDAMDEEVMRWRLSAQAPAVLRLRNDNHTRSECDPQTKKPASRRVFREGRPPGFHREDPRYAWIT